MSEPKVVTPPQFERTKKVFNYELTFVAAKDLRTNTVLNQGRFLTDFPMDCGPEEMAAYIDLLQYQADRQLIMNEIGAREAQIAQWQIDFEEAEAAFNAQKAAIEKKISDAQAAHERREQEARNAHANSNRRGDFHPEGKTKRNLDTLERARQLAQEDLQKEDAEREKAQLQLQVEIAKSKRVVAHLHATLKAKRKLLDAAGR